MVQPHDASYRSVVLVPYEVRLTWSALGCTMTCVYTCAAVGFCPAVLPCPDFSARTECRFSNRCNATGHITEGGHVEGDKAKPCIVQLQRIWDGLWGWHILLKCGKSLCLLTLFAGVADKRCRWRRKVKLSDFRELPYPRTSLSVVRPHAR